MTPTRDAGAPVFSREPNGLIALRVTQEEFDELLLVLGYAGGSAAREQNRWMLPMSLRLVNRLNTGNPDFRPYEVPGEVPV